MRGLGWVLAAAVLCLPAVAAATSQNEQVPARGANEGGGPYPTLVIRGATLIPGDGAPPIGPVDITIHGNRIADVSLPARRGRRFAPIASRAAQPAKSMRPECSSCPG